MCIIPDQYIMLRVLDPHHRPTFGVNSTLVSNVSLSFIFFISSFVSVRRQIAYTCIVPCYRVVYVYFFFFHFFHGISKL